MATFTTSAQVDLNVLTELAGTPVTITNGAAPLSGASKDLSAQMDQTAFTSLMNSYSYDAATEPGQEGMPERGSNDILQPYVGRVDAVLAGTDAFAGQDIQNILAAFVRSQTVG